MSQTYTFKPGDKVLISPVAQENRSQAQYQKPCKIVRRVNTIDYVIEIPGQRKSTKLCKVNMLKPYIEKTVYVK